MDTLAEVADATEQGIQPVCKHQDLVIGFLAHTGLTLDPMNRQPNPRNSNRSGCEELLYLCKAGPEGGMTVTGERPHRPHRMDQTRGRREAVRWRQLPGHRPRLACGRRS